MEQKARTFRLKDEMLRLGGGSLTLEEGTFHLSDVLLLLGEAIFHLFAATFRLRDPSLHV